MGGFLQDPVFLLTGGIFFVLVVLGILSSQRVLLLGYLIMLACAWFLAEILVRLGGVGVTS